MTFTENIHPRNLRSAAWGFPLFLLILNLPIPFILWAGQSLAGGIDADYYVLGITLGGGSQLLTVFAFLGGVSAASAMMIVTTVALSAMALNHLVLPASIPDPTVNLYRWLLWGRRVVIAVIVLAGYGFYVALEHNQRLVELGLISFVAVAQFLPGIAGVLYWDRANRNGFMAGLGGGTLVWFVALFLPLVDQAGEAGAVLQPWLDYTGMDKLTFVTFWSLTINAGLFVLVSLGTRQSPEEADAAGACVNEGTLPQDGVLEVASTAEFTDKLGRLIGADMARKEVHLALDDLGLAEDVSHPASLRRLRERIERNLSGLLGPELARSVVNQQLRMDSRTRSLFADSIRIIEERLETSRLRLRGLLGELDSLRRYHRQVLEKLPSGVCSIGPDREIVIWNDAMAALSGIGRGDAMGRQLERLPAPWCDLLGRFLEGGDSELTRIHVTVDGQARWLNLHKAQLDRVPGVAAADRWRETSGTVLLIEDITDKRKLEAELAHADRLASLGRLAAGVAHEIGNPVTGIACLAQNLREESDDPGVRESVDQILDQTRRISAIVGSLVSFSHGGQDHEPRQAVNIRECVDEAIRLVGMSRSGRRMACSNECDATVYVEGVRQKLLQVFVNLLSNACQACGDGDPVVISAGAAAGSVEVCIRDRGTGIDPGHIERVFEPFFTTKEPGEGTGLGLPLVYNIVKDHAGSIDISSPESGGTLVRMRFPVYNAGHPAGEAAVQS